MKSTIHFKGTIMNGSGKDGVIFYQRQGRTLVMRTAQPASQPVNQKAALKMKKQQNAQKFAQQALRYPPAAGDHQKVRMRPKSLLIIMVENLLKDK